MTAKFSASADGTKVTIGTAAEDALQIDATAKTIKAVSPYIIEADGPSGAGYSKQSDGTLIQWGVASTLSTGQQTVAYPVAFVGTLPVITATCGGVVAFNFAIVSDIGLSNFGLGSIQHDGTRVSAAGVQWQAIGKWK